MIDIETLRFLHILMFVGWLGGDAGVYIASRKAMDSSLQFETRLMLLHTALRIELIPRTMWKAALPLGVMLSRKMGLLDISDTGVIIVWVLTTIWWACSMVGAYYYYEDFGKKLITINNWLVGIAGLLILYFAWTSSIGEGPLDADSSWLLWKFALFGLVQFTALGIILTFAPLGPEFMMLGEEGSSPELEQSITRHFNIAAIPIWATYILIFIIAWLGTTKFI
jgi:hypothetical protein